MTAITTEVRISREHAQQINELRRRYGHETSSHAFNTLYIWRRISGCMLHLEPELYSLRYEAKGENTWLFPCGSEDAICRFIEAKLDEPGFALCYLRAQDVRLLETHFPGRFNIQPAPGDSEYIVSRDDHISLTGKRFYTQRWERNRAEKEHTIEIQPLSPDNIDDAIEILREWHSSRSEKGSLHLIGDEADAGPLRSLDELQITGLLMIADGVPFGVAACYPLTEDTSDMFLAKAARKDPALGYYMRREMIRMLPETFRFVNLEDDLEIEGLRAMKEHMAPVKMNEMWMAVRA